MTKQQDENAEKAQSESERNKKKKKIHDGVIESRRERDVLINNVFVHFSRMISFSSKYSFFVVFRVVNVN